MSQQGTSTPTGATATDPIGGDAAKIHDAKIDPLQAQHPQQPGGGGAPGTGTQHPSSPPGRREGVVSDPDAADQP